MSDLLLGVNVKSSFSSLFIVIPLVWIHSSNSSRTSDITTGIELLSFFRNCSFSILLIYNNDFTTFVSRASVFCDSTILSAISCGREGDAVPHEAVRRRQPLEHVDLDDQRGLLEELFDGVKRGGPRTNDGDAKRMIGGSYGWHPAERTSVGSRQSVVISHSR